jgi:hypothetical protein
LCRALLLTGEHAVHFGAAYRTGTLRGRASVRQGNFLSLKLTFFLAFHAVTFITSQCPFLLSQGWDTATLLSRGARNGDAPKVGVKEAHLAR